MKGNDHGWGRPPVELSKRALAHQVGLTRLTWLQAFDGTILLLLGIAPLVMGGRHPWGRCVYVLLIALCAACWSFHQARDRVRPQRRSGLEWPVCAAWLLILLQFLSLPSGCVQFLSPRIVHYLPLWNSAAGQRLWDGWSTLSLTPMATFQGGTLFVAQSLLAWLVYQRLQDRADIERYQRWIALSIIGLATLGLLQYLFSNNKFLWIHQDPFRGTQGIVRGPFYNENHFAHLLALGLLPLLGWIQRWRAERHWQRQRFATHRPGADGQLTFILLLISVPTVLLALLLTRSRGGILVGLGALLMAEWAIWQRANARRALGRMLVVSVVMLTALSVHGLDGVRDELSTLASGNVREIDQGSGKRNLWRAARQVAGQFTLCGAGVGSFREVYPLFYSEPRYHDYGYAESGYLHIAAETGLAGCLLLGWAGWSLVRVLGPLLRLRMHPEHGANPGATDAILAMPCYGALLLSGLHACVDFVWFIPACLVPTLMLVVCGMRLRELRRHDSPRVDGAVTTVGCGSAGEWQEGAPPRMLRWGWAGAVLLFLAAMGMLPAARGAVAWNRYLLAVQQERNEAGWGRGGTAVVAEPDDQALLEQRALLHRVIEADPHHGRARVHLSSLCLQIFEREQQRSENPLPLAQIRDAALASQFRSAAEQDRWLAVVLENRRVYLDEALRHAMAALADCPLMGRAYVVLSELSFLQSPAADRPQRLMRQALRVRPYDPQVLFAAGREAALSSDTPRAITYWRRAFHQDVELQQAIMRQMGPLLPARAFLVNFEPSLETLPHLRAVYMENALDEDAQQVALAYLQTLSEQADQLAGNGDAWQTGYRIAAEIGHPDAVAFAQEALRRDPLNEIMRRRLGLELLARGDRAEAIKQLEQYLKSNPNDRQVLHKLEAARREVPRVPSAAVQSARPLH